MFNFRTDLANERRDIYKKANKISDEIQGVQTDEKQERRKYTCFQGENYR